MYPDRPLQACLHKGWPVYKKTQGAARRSVSFFPVVARAPPARRVGNAGGQIPRGSGVGNGRASIPRGSGVGNGRASNPRRGGVGNGGAQIPLPQGRKYAAPIFWPFLTSFSSCNSPWASYAPTACYIKACCPRCNNFVLPWAATPSTNSSSSYKRPR